MEFSHMGASGRGGVEFLRHSPASHDEVAYLAIGECAKGEEEGEGFTLRVGVVLAVLDGMDIHVVVPQGYPIPELSGGQPHIRDELASHIALLQQEATYSNRSPSITDIGKFAYSVACPQVFACQFEWQLCLSLKPFVEADGAVLGFFDGSVVDASPPVVFAEFCISKEEISIAVVVSRTIPILECEFTYFRIKTLSNQSTIPPNLVHCVSCY